MFFILFVGAYSFELANCIFIYSESIKTQWVDSDCEKESEDTKEIGEKKFTSDSKSLSQEMIGFNVMNNNYNQHHKIFFSCDYRVVVYSPPEMVSF